MSGCGQRTSSGVPCGSVTVCGDCFDKEDLPFDEAKNPDKMSLRELRAENKKLRQEYNTIFARGYRAGHDKGWKACGEKIMEEMKGA